MNVRNSSLKFWYSKDNTYIFHNKGKAVDFIGKTGTELRFQFNNNWKTIKDYNVAANYNQTDVAVDTSF